MSDQATSSVNRRNLLRFVDGASSFHPGGANFCFADGSVHFMENSISTWPFNLASVYPTGVTDSNGVQTFRRARSSGFTRSARLAPWARSSAPIPTEYRVTESEVLRTRLTTSCAPRFVKGGCT